MLDNCLNFYIYCALIVLMASLLLGFYYEVPNRSLSLIEETAVCTTTSILGVCVYLPGNGHEK